VLALEIARQLQKSGDIVTHLFLIDPYFRVNDVYHELNIAKSDIDLVGRLNYKYNPQEITLNENTKVILFKAMLEHNFDSKNEANRLFDYYVNSLEFNNLDLVVKNITKIIEQSLCY